MPSNEKRASQDPANFKTTLVLHLKEKNNVEKRRQGSFEEERVDQFNERSGDNGEAEPVHLGDRVVWVTDSGPELGYIRWLGFFDDLSERMAGVEFDNPIGTGTGMLKRKQLFSTAKNYASFLPLMGLVKADDFFEKPRDYAKKKVRSFKLIEQCSGLNHSHHGSTFNQPEEVDCESVSRAEAENATCRSELVLPNNTSKARNVNSSRNLGNYPIGEASPRAFLPGDTYPSVSVRSTEPKIRHSYSQDSTLRVGSEQNVDLMSNLTSGDRGREESKAKSRANNSEAFLEIVGEGIRLSPPSLTKSVDLGVGSVVEVTVKGDPRYGVIRWIGVVPEDRKLRKVAGIEMEEEYVGCSDGTFNGRRYFQCNSRKALFVSLSQCQKDSRFQDVHPPVTDNKARGFGQVDCPVVPGAVPPVSHKGDLEALCGKYRGIQGHHNSCYLDATLFSMFTFTSVFDSLLFRPPTEKDIVHYEKVQRVLREEIVNPLRQNLYVRADRVMKLRTLLENLSSVTGLTSEEKDPEEFLTSLVAQILRAEPFLKLSSGQEAYHYQLFVEKDDQLVLPTVQQLMEQSFLSSDIKLKEVPSCLIIQMPRFGKSFKMYPRILPSQLLDVTDIIEDSPRQCTVCGKLAEFECKECFGQCGSGLESIAFCINCLETAHSHQRRSSHAWRRLTDPIEFSVLRDHCPIPRLYMELFAVVCIETSHYVAFVKCGSGSEAPWCFFDSMADRKGEQNGYNIPEMVLCPNLPYWLSDEGALSLTEMRDDRQLPEHAKRLLCDAYMCMYQSPDVMMYR